MVFMPRRSDGHPMAAMLLLFSMFAFALVFHAVTRPRVTIAGHFNTQLAALAQPVAPRLPAMVSAQAAGAALALPVARSEMAPPSIPATAFDATPVIHAMPASLAMAYLPASIDAAPPELSAVSGGAVTRGVAATRSALRTAFKKAF
jgi:hypothetical protein